MADKKIITWDIETIADKSVIPFLPPVKPNGTLKDAIKIKADIEKKEIDRIAKLGLDPTTARICCFGWHYDFGKEKTHHLILKDESPEAEKALIQKTWDILSTGDHFVTFNGISFDVPMLLMRSLINRVRPAVQISTKKYTIQNHTDVRAVLSNWDAYKPGTLDYYSRLLLGKTPKGEFDGSDVQMMYEMEMFEDIGNYCKQDTQCTFEIYELLTQYYL